MMKKINYQDRELDVGNKKNPRKITPQADVECQQTASKCGDETTVCGTKGWDGKPIMAWRTQDNDDFGPITDEKLDASILIIEVKHVTRRSAGHIRRGNVSAPAFPDSLSFLPGPAEKLRL